MKFVLLTAVIVVLGNTQTLPTIDMGTILYFLSQAYDIVDTNNDNDLSNREQAAMFEFLDQNNDGCVTYEEYSGLIEVLPGYEDLMRANFYFIDSVSATTEADGCASRQDVQEFYKLMDLNGDDITLQEYDTSAISVGKSLWDALQSLGLYTTHRP